MRPRSSHRWGDISSSKRIPQNTSREGDLSLTRILTVPAVRRAPFPAVLA